MRTLFKPTARSRAEMKKEKMRWDWNAWNKARRRKKMQRRMLQAMQKSPWAGVAGGLAAGAAGLLAFFAFQSAAERKKAGGEFASDPLSAPRFDRKRAFGWF